MMKTKLFFIVFFCAFVACSKALPEFSDKDSISLETEETILTRSTDSIDDEVPVPLEESEEMEALRNLYQETLQQTPSMMAYNQYDPNFSMNVYAIREMPIRFRLREDPSGYSNRYLSCEGKGKEVKWYANSINDDKQKFYLKIFPATTGIPYLIYSKTSNTPLTVGYYNNNPDEKIMFAASTDDGSYYSEVWDLNPISNYKGFSIQSMSYLGQSDPDNMYSVFYHVLEAKTGNLIRYAQYSGIPEQQFSIEVLDNFSLSDIDFDLASATISEGNDIIISFTGTNPSLNSKTVNCVKSSEDLVYKERSYFAETQGYLKFNLSNTDLNIQLPSVVANRVVILDDNSKTISAQYRGATQYIDETISYNVSVTAPPRSLIMVDTYVKTHNVSINYTAKATLNDREITLNGVWRGFLISDPSLTTPTHVTSFYDLDTNEEILDYSLANVEIL